MNAGKMTKEEVELILDNVTVNSELQYSECGGGIDCTGGSGVCKEGCKEACKTSNKNPTCENSCEPGCSQGCQPSCMSSKK